MPPCIVVDRRCRLLQLLDCLSLSPSDAWTDGCVANEDGGVGHQFIYYIRKILLKFPSSKLASLCNMQVQGWAKE